MRAAAVEALPELVTADPADPAVEPWPDAPQLPGAPDPDPLPVDVLPPGLRAHVDSVAAATQTPPALGTMLCLAAVSAATRGRYEVSIDHRGWREAVCIYAVPVLPPASRKSAVYAAMVGPIEERERELRDVAAPEYRRRMDALDVATAALATAKARAAKGDADADVEEARKKLDTAEAAVPVLPRIVLSDATPEALVRTMAEQGGTVALLGPEADPLGLAEGRYSETPRLDEMLRAWSGEPITVDRIGRDTIHIPRATLTLGITIQPAALGSLRHGRVHRGRGLWGRILWCVPPHGLGSRLTGRDVPRLDEEAARTYAAILRHLLDTAMEIGGSAEPVRTLELTGDARRLVWDYEREIEDQLGDGRPLAGFRDWAGKVVGQAVRLAALLELAARAEDGRPLSEPIGAWAMNGAIRLTRALTTHARRVLQDDEAGETLRYILRRAGEIPTGSTLRDLHDATRDRPGLETMDDLRPYVDELVRLACLRLVGQPRPGPGRPRSPLVELHPAISPRPPETPPQNPHNTADRPELVNTAGIAGAISGAPTESEEYEI